MPIESAFELVGGPMCGEEITVDCETYVAHVKTANGITEHKYIRDHFSETYFYDGIWEGK